MATTSRPIDPNVLYYKHIVLTMVRNEDIFFDLTDRQRAVMLVVYTDRPPDGHTVRGLASTLQVERPAITRALNRLTDFNLIERQSDPLDGRSIVVTKTTAGISYMKSLRSTVASAGRKMAKQLHQANLDADRYQRPFQ